MPISPSVLQVRACVVGLVSHRLWLTQSVVALGREPADTIGGPPPRQTRPSMSAEAPEAAAIEDIQPIAVIPAEAGTSAPATAQPRHQVRELFCMQIRGFILFRQPPLSPAVSCHCGRHTLFGIN